MKPRWFIDTPEGFYKHERFNDYSTIRRIQQTGTLAERIFVCHGLLTPDERASLVPQPVRPTPSP